MQSGSQSPGGDILRACWTGSAWSLESDGVCNGTTTFGNYGYNNQDGPGGGLFYWDQNGREGNATLGALAQVPGYNNVVTMGTDVREFDGMMGPMYINHDTGASDIWSPVFMIGFGNDIWGKGNGMGDMEILYDPAPIELGNRVWNDANGNGIQDPGETPIAGVTVQLWADTDANGSADTQVGTAVTAADGTYYFVSGTAADPNTGDNSGIVFYNGGGIQPNTAYEVRVATSQAQLSGKKLTAPNAPQPANGNASATDNNPITDVADSDATISGANAVIAYTTGGPGINNHGLDFGFSPPIDYGDLPDTTSGTGAGNYQTLLSDNGPRHVISSGLNLGAPGVVDAETDGQPNATATGDDINPSTADDEEAIASFPTFTAGQPAAVTVAVNNPAGGIGAATLYGFIDWNNDGDFGDLGEAVSVAVPDGTVGNVALNFSVPLSATTGTSLGARFRLTTDTLALNNTGAQGPASNGEVEDYVVNVQALDFGDLPDTGAGTGAGNYQTLLSDNGPRHVISSGLNLGAAGVVDPDSGLLQNVGATLDDTTNTGFADDEEAIASFPTFTAGQPAAVTVAVNNPAGGIGAATLYGFIDWNNDGDFGDLGEAVSVAVPDGTVGNVALNFSVPLAATTGTSLGARFRLTTDTLALDNSGAQGLASNGEVEDYVVSVQAPPAELRLNKVASSATVVAGDLVTYTLTYSNVGAGPATGVVITETVPEHTVFVAANSTAGWSCADGAQPGVKCVFTVGTLAPNQKGSVLFVARVDVNVPADVTIPNVAVIAGPDTPPGEGGSNIIPKPKPPTALETFDEPEASSHRLYLPMIVR